MPIFSFLLIFFGQWPKIRKAHVSAKEIMVHKDISEKRGTWPGRLKRVPMVLCALALGHGVASAQDESTQVPEAWVMVELPGGMAMLVTPTWSVQAPTIHWDARQGRVLASGPGCVYTDTVWNARFVAKTVTIEHAGAAQERVVIETMSFGQELDTDSLDPPAAR